MPRIDLVVEVPVSDTPRARQLEGLFDVPRVETSRLEWHMDVPFEDRPWKIGLVVGPSGSGKTSLAKKLFPNRVDVEVAWKGGAVVDDFRADLSVAEVARACKSVGFNTIPAWLRPYHVLSNGEKFRVDLARRLLELGSPVVVDEFTSVVDRRVAHAASHAAQKYVRKGEGQFVAITCHADVEEWLQPDWVLDMGVHEFRWRSVQPRPSIDVEIRQVPYSEWKRFSPFHYLTASLNRSAKCYGLFAFEQIVAFSAILFRPHPRVRDIVGCSRLVTLPDWQGMGLAMILNDELAAMHKALGYRFRVYPAHPALIRSYDNSPIWALKKKPGLFASVQGAMSSLGRAFVPGNRVVGVHGGRPNAVFEYAGPAKNKDRAQEILGRKLPSKQPRTGIATKATKKR